MTPIEVTSIGVVGAGAHNFTEFGRLLYSTPAGNDTMAVQQGMHVPVRRVDDEAWAGGFDKRWARRLDRFSQLAVYAAEQCLAGCSSYAEKSQPDPFRVGLCIGNNYGGWSYVEPMMKPLYETGMKAINPYVATAWFPAAAQGEISIRLGIKGVSKTFSVERLSGAYAIDYARYLLEQGSLELVVAGGAESPLTPVILASMQYSNVISSELPAGEAACMLALRKATSDRNPQIVGIGTGRDAGTSLANALRDAALQASAIDLVLLDPPRGAGDARRQHVGNQLLAARSLSGSGSVAQALPFGEAVGAAFSLQIAAACVALQQQRIPVSQLESAYRAELEQQGFQGNGRTAPLIHVAVLASDGYGQWMSAIVRRLHTDAGKGGNGYGVN